jgi:site-specific DNA recombinase
MTDAIRACGYVRVSTEEQAEHGYSLDEQERRIREAIAAKGWGEPQAIYRDAGWSGAREDRPELQRMLADLDGIDVVFIWAMDRLTRDLLLFAKLVKLLNDANVRIESLSAHVDLQTPEGEAMAGVAAVFGQFERKRIGERVRAAAEARARQGLYSGGAPPYGYRLQDKKLVNDPEQAAVVRRIFADYCNGVGQRGIVRSLGDEWHQSTISRILASPTYLGKLEFKGKVLPGVHEPIIDQDTWDRAQAIRAGANRQRGGRHADGGHLLTRGTLRCPSCGSAMLPRKARPGVERERYVCGGRIGRGPEFCGQPSIRRELIDEPFLSHLLDAHIDIEATRQRIEERASTALSGAREAVREREVEAARIERALAVTERDYDSGTITGKQYTAREARLSGELEGARNALERTRDHADQLDSGAVPGDAEQALLDHLAALKAAASGQAGAAPDLAALRNVIGDMFEYVQLVRAGELPPSGAPTGGLMPIEGDVPTPPRVDGGRYWLLAPLRLSAVDATTFKPIGQEIPVPVWQAYPEGFLWRYCWW